MTRPNFLLIMTDQHRADHVGFGGNEVIQTPHLDGLAAGGMVFDRAYVSNPICQPNRSTILTGRVPSVHGTRDNGIPLDPRSNTFVRVLREAGYRTGLIGKGHLQNIGNRPELAVALADASKVGDARQLGLPGWDTWELESRYDDPTADHIVPPDYYGFDHVDLVIDHADYAGGHYRVWLREQGVDPAAVQGPQFALETAEEWWQVYKPQLPEELYPTAYVEMRTHEFLEAAARGSDPFFVQMSFADPHHPFSPPGRYWERYDAGAIPLPATFDDDVSRAMPHIQAMRRDRGTQSRPMSPWSPNTQQFRRAAAAEYGAISMIDDAVGRVCSTLRRLGLADNTYVVFTSDHGDMFGDHGILLKSTMHYSGTTRIPLMVNGPGIQGGRSGALVGSLDIASTVLGLAGLPEYQGIQGRSLQPLLDGSATKLRDWLLIEEDRKLPLQGRDEPLRMRTVVTDDARYTRYSGEQHGEFFDLAADPQESANLFGLPEHREREDALRDTLLEAVLGCMDEGVTAKAMA